MTPIRWLRISYWTGAIVDAAAAVLMFFPEAGRAVYGLRDFEPTVDYRYAMRLGASLMLGWTLLLVWADRKPVERRGLLPITVLVIIGLAWAGAYAVSAGLIPIANMLPSWGLQLALVALFTYSYARSRAEAARQALGSGALPLEEAVAQFLAQKRVAVAGVSRAGNAPANAIFRKLRASGREVYPINPHADTVEGVRCYTTLADLPEPPDAVMIVTHPDQAMDVARQCKEAGVRYVWFHRSIDAGSYSPEAAALCTSYGAVVIPGSCPMMHLAPIDGAHWCMRAVLRIAGKLPKGVQVAQD
jgi:predicted CoA-binding protein